MAPFDTGGNAGFGRAKLVRVTRTRPCPVCGRTTWCLAAEDGSAAICPRTPNGATKDLGDAGYLHILDDRLWQPRPTRSFSRRIALADTDMGTDWGEIARRFEHDVDAKRLIGLAESLGLSEDSLRRLSVGWSRRHTAWTFPMRDARGLVRGIRLRCPNGRKLSVRGGHEGLFLPSQLTGSRVLVCEGPTDAAALLDLGFAAIGRPSCRGAVQLTVELVRSLQLEEVVIVADHDDAGRTGAAALAATLIVYARQLRVITPPDAIKDARAWKAAGATHKDVLTVVEAAGVRSISIKAGHTDGRR